MGVLRVNDGTALLPDWRNVGCGGASATPTSQTFSYTGGAQTFVVPAGVTSLTAEVWGAEGGHAFGSANTNQKGGYLKATISTTPGETLGVYVGEYPGTRAGGGFNGGGGGGGGSATGGGGGGASDVRQGGSALANRVAVAGGGGGAGVDSNGGTATGHDGGAGGGTTGGDGQFMGATADTGKGGTQSAGGAAGTPTSGGVVTGTAGALGVGGRGAGDNFTSAGGGGGGYYGGGGGGYEAIGSRTPGGGGGSSYSSGTIVTNTQGSRTGHGQVVLTWTPSPTTGRLKLWDGTRWMREVCDNDPTVPTLLSTGASNILTGNNATGDTGVGSWGRDPASTFNSTRVTLETGIMRTGAGCIRLDNNNGSGDARMILPSGLFAASPGDHHWFSCWGRDQDNVWHRNVGIEYLDSSGAVLATAQTVYPNNSANVYRQLTHWNTAGAPAGTAWVRPFVGFGASTGGYYTMCDDLELRTATVLVPERHPLKMWDGTTWQTVACMTPA